MHKCVICFEDSHCNPALGQNCDLSTHECVSNATCAAAISKLPYGGVYNWDDGTTQGFKIKEDGTGYWNLYKQQESDPDLTRSGEYSFGKYSGYSINRNAISPLAPATDLSQCKQCAVKATFYVKGRICDGNCSAQTFLHPVCNSEGNVDAVDVSDTTWSQWSQPPSSPWICEEWDFFKDT